MLQVLTEMKRGGALFCCILDTKFISLFLFFRETRTLLVREKQQNKIEQCNSIREDTQLYVFMMD